MFCTHYNLFTAATVAYILHTALTSQSQKPPTATCFILTVRVNKSHTMFRENTSLCWDNEHTGSHTFSLEMQQRGNMKPQHAEPISRISVNLESFHTHPSVHLYRIHTAPQSATYPLVTHFQAC